MFFTNAANVFPMEEIDNNLIYCSIALHRVKKSFFTKLFSFVIVVLLYRETWGSSTT